MASSCEDGHGSGLAALTAGDWVGMAATALAALGCVGYGVFEVPVWSGMFNDFGAKAALPFWTSIALWRPFAFLPAVLSLGCLAAGLLPGQRALPWRRSWIVVAFLIAVLGLGFMIWAVRLPLWQLADAVQA